MTDLVRETLDTGPPCDHRSAVRDSGPAGDDMGVKAMGRTAGSTSRVVRPAEESDTLSPHRHRSANGYERRPWQPRGMVLYSRTTRTFATREDTMNEVLQRFEALAARACTGEAGAEREFFDEAARLFPADFADDGQFAKSSAGAGVEDRLNRALAIIRQNVTTGG